MPTRLAGCPSLAVVAILAGSRGNADVIVRLDGRPGIGLVASVAIVEGGDMRRVLEYRAHVVAGHVATRAVVRCSLVHAVDMAGSATGLDMGTGQGEPGLAVIEFDQVRIWCGGGGKVHHDQQREYQQQSDPPRLVPPDTYQFIFSCLVHLASP